MRGGMVVLHSFVLVVLFLIGAIFVNPLTDGIENNILRITVKELLRIAFTIGMLLFYVKFVLKKSNTFFRIHRWVKEERRWAFVGLAMALMVIAFYLVTKLVTFERLDPHISFIMISFITASSAGIIEEFLFRGYLLKLFEEKWNIVAAVVITSILFAALHLLTVNELQSKDIWLIIFAGCLVSSLFSLIVYKTGNVWNAVVVHIGWNFIMNPQMVRLIPPKGESHPSFLLLRFQSDKTWITGGAFGLEASIPALILYSLIIIVLVFYKKQPPKRMKGLSKIPFFR